MEKIIKYRGLESVTYKFTKGEIREALMKQNEIKSPPLGVSAVLELYEDDTDNVAAELTLTYDFPLSKKQEK